MEATTFDFRSLIMRGVNPLLTRRRYRVWSGGSMLSIIIRCCSSISSSKSWKRVPRRDDEKCS